MIFFLIISLFFLKSDYSLYFHSLFFVNLFVTFISTILILQGLFTLAWMLYAWNDPVEANTNKSPKSFSPPHYSFTALVPARHEEKVIEDTINAINRINYPDYLKEILILCRFDDQKTIKKVKDSINKCSAQGIKNINLLIFDGTPINKPHALNKGLLDSKNDIVAIFDAEDEPHSDIYNIVNTVMSKDEIDVVQSGVQLINYQSRWFSPFNVMEYYFWYKSGLHFFNKIGLVTPLGGNTVFFKRGWLNQIKGWDDKCLTEDADIGIRLSLAGAKTKIVYDEVHTTREETPHSVDSLIKQRTRWNQGFLQIFLKGDWNNFPLIRQKLTLMYVLLSPFILSSLFVYLPFGVIIATLEKLPLLITLFSMIPLYLLGLLVLTVIIGFYKFTKDYNYKFHIFTPLKILITFYPYLLILMISSIRAFYRELLGRNGWEKTLHKNAHRKIHTVSVST